MKKDVIYDVPGVVLDTYLTLRFKPAAGCRVVISGNSKFLAPNKVRKNKLGKGKNT